MDRRVKERLVGAAILVAIVVLVVPELLPGSPRRAAATSGHDAPVAEPRDPMRTVTVDISPNSVGPVPAPASESAPRTATSASGARVAGGPPPDARSASATAVAAPKSTAPQPGAVPAAILETPRSAPTSVASTPASRTVAGPVAAEVAATGGGSWAVQLGSFKDRANALRLARYWKSKGYPAYLSSIGGGARALHRVRIGPYRDRKAALGAIAKLRKRGERANLVAPGR